MPRASLRQRLREFYRALFPEGQSPLSISLSVFVGVFVGVLPTLGFALPLTAVVAGVLRLPKGPGLVASFIATPPTLFLFFYPLGYFVGRSLTRPAEIQLDFLAEMQALSLTTLTDVLGRLWAEARAHVVAFMLGMTIVALVTAAIISVLAHWIIVHRTPPETLD